RFGIQRMVTELAAAFPSELAAQVVPEPGVGELLARLASSRRVAIVRNGSRPAPRGKMHRPGVASAAVLLWGELGVATPARGIFERALAWSELGAADCLFVGDDPINDLAPAAALGMATAWRVRDRWPRELAAPQFTVTTLAELEAFA